MASFDGCLSLNRFFPLLLLNVATFEGLGFAWGADGTALPISIFRLSSTVWSAQEAPLTTLLSSSSDNNTAMRCGVRLTNCSTLP